MNYRSKLFRPPSSWTRPSEVHGYSEEFQRLARSRIPQLLRSLDRQLQQPVVLSSFAKRGRGLVTIRRSEAFTTHLEGLDREIEEATSHTDSLRSKSEKSVKPQDFSGLYVLVSSNGPFYVGISRAVITRLRNHVNSDSHKSASLFYKMTADLAGHHGKRENLNLRSDEAVKIQEWLRRQRVAILPLACPVERYLLELAAAMELKTDR